MRRGGHQRRPRGGSVPGTAIALGVGRSSAVCARAEPNDTPSDPVDDVRTESSLSGSTPQQRATEDGAPDIEGLATAGTASVTPATLPIADPAAHVGRRTVDGATSRTSPTACHAAWSACERDQVDPYAAPKTGQQQTQNLLAESKGQRQGQQEGQIDRQSAEIRHRVAMGLEVSVRPVDDTETNRGLAHARRERSGQHRRHRQGQDVDLEPTGPLQTIPSFSYLIHPSRAWPGRSHCQLRA